MRLPNALDSELEVKENDLGHRSFSLKGILWTLINLEKNQCSNDSISTPSQINQTFCQLPTQVATNKPSKVAVTGGRPLCHSAMVKSHVCWENGHPTLNKGNPYMYCIYININIYIYTMHKEISSLNSKSLLDWWPSPTIQESMGV